MLSRFSFFLSSDAEGQCWFQEYWIFGKSGKIPEDVYENLYDKIIWVSIWVKKSTEQEVVCRLSRYNTYKIILNITISQSNLLWFQPYYFSSSKSKGHVIFLIEIYPMSVFIVIVANFSHLQNHWANISLRLCTKNSSVNMIQVCSSERSHLFPQDSTNTFDDFLRIFFLKSTESVSSKLGTKYP